MNKKIQLDQNGLVPAIAQHAETSEILMMGYMNPSSLTVGGDLSYGIKVKLLGIFFVQKILL